MKLKLEIQDGATILCVTEDLSIQHAAILKAGLAKLLAAGKKVLILDLTGVTDAEPTTLKEVANIQDLTAGTDHRLIIASHVAGVGQASSREEALKLVNSALGILLGSEARLQARVNMLDQHREKLLRTSQQSGFSDAEAKRLRKENSDLKQMIRELETQISQILSKRVEAKPSELLKSRAQTISRTLTAVLEQEGIIPLK